MGCVCAKNEISSPIVTFGDENTYFISYYKSRLSLKVICDENGIPQTISFGTMPIILKQMSSVSSRVVFDRSYISISVNGVALRSIDIPLVCCGDDYANLLASALQSFFNSVLDYHTNNKPFNNSAIQSLLREYLADPSFEVTL